jgi:biopolymer transport protein ExbB
MITLPLLLGGIPVGGADAQEAAVEETVQTVATEDLPVADDGRRTLRDWYALGGWIMHLIVGCSVVSFTLVLERLWSLRRRGVIPKKFLQQVRDHWNRRGIPEVFRLCEEADTSISRVLRAGLTDLDEGLTRVEDAIETAASHEHTILRRNLSLLSSVANIATMLGLLGTVLGMIESFDLIAKTGTGDARVVAGGIFQALVTTAAGLMVGIFTIAAYSYFRRRVEILIIELEDISFRFLEALSKEPEAESRMNEQSELAPAEA